MKCYLSCRRREEKRAGRVWVCQAAFRTLIISPKRWSCLKMTEFLMPPSYTQVERTAALAVDLSPIYSHWRQLFPLHSFAHSLPLPFSILRTFSSATLHPAPSILLSPDHSNLCTDGGASMPMPRQLRRWHRQPCLKALCAFQI